MKKFGNAPDCIDHSLSCWTIRFPVGVRQALVLKIS